MEINDTVKTLVEMKFKERGYDVIIPKGSIGRICEVHDTWAFVEVAAQGLPEGEGVFEFDFSEIEVIKKCS